MQKYEDLEPKKVFYWFKQLNDIPRGSGNEKAVSDFLVSFAKERELEVYQDSLNNVIIKKDATEGYENSEPVILQGHMDMVCEKTDDSDHDFLKDPISMHVKDGYVYADNTTLGADDGIAVAFCLAILDSDDVSHPKLEVLVTIDEERGMDGANGVTAEHLSGTRLLNIDTETEGDFIV
ncbi:MAG: M20/M25/M40 family metallo-hydrolase, partial [Finegoldia magna]